MRFAIMAMTLSVTLVSGCSSVAKVPAEDLSASLDRHFVPATKAFMAALKDTGLEHEYVGKTTDFYASINKLVKLTHGEPVDTFTASEALDIIWMTEIWFGNYRGINPVTGTVDR